MVLALVVMVVALALVVPVVAGAVHGPVTAPPRLCVRAGTRAVALRLPPCVRAGTRAVGGRWRSGRCRVRTPCVRAGRLAAAEFVWFRWSSGSSGPGMDQADGKLEEV